MSIVVFLLIGLIAGWIASHVMEGHGFGALGDIVVGIVGAFIGGFIFNIIGVANYGFWGAVGTSAVGAIVFLFLLALVPGSGGGSRPLGKL